MLWKFGKINLYRAFSKVQEEYAVLFTVNTTVIITGGYHMRMTMRTVSRYSTAGHIEDLPSLNQGRENHGCGAYTDDSGELEPEEILGVFMDRK